MNLPNCSVLGLFTLMIFFISSASCQTSSPEKNAKQLYNVSRKDLPEGHPLGMLTMLELDFAKRNRTAIIDVKLPDDEKFRVATGSNPWRHSNGSLVFTVGCGKIVNYVQISEPNGKTKKLTPCSKDLKSPTNLPRQFGTGQLSPNQELLAVESLYSKGIRNYSNVAIYRNGKQIEFVDGDSPTWVDNDTYIVVSNGLYLVDLGEKPKRINPNIISGVGDVDVSPDGKKLVFEWNQQLWTMNIDGSGLKKRQTGSLRYTNPVWSPNGEFIAFLASGNYNEERKVFSLDLTRDKLWSSNIKPQLGMNYLRGPLSWVRSDL